MTRLISSYIPLVLFIFQTQAKAYSKQECIVEWTKVTPFSAELQKADQKNVLSQELKKSVTQKVNILIEKHCAGSKDHKYFRFVSNLRQDCYDACVADTKTASNDNDNWQLTATICRTACQKHGDLAFDFYSAYSNGFSPCSKPDGGIRLKVTPVTKGFTYKSENESKAKNSRPQLPENASDHSNKGYALGVQECEATTNH